VAAAIALEVNDAGLLLLREGEGRPRPDSPGLAWFEGDAVRVGASAVRQSRQNPRAIHDRFWDPLALDPLGPTGPDGLRGADLAHAHLRSLRESLPEPPLEAFLAVPGFWSASALGLLLHAARSAGFPVVGLVDSAVAGASFFARGEEVLHLELTLHRSVVTVLRAGPTVERVRVAESAGPGQSAFERALLEGIARRFVQGTRFDPLHSGASEQALAEALPTWLFDLRRAESIPAKVMAGSREMALELSRMALAADLAPLYARLLAQVEAERARASTVLLVSARAARLPGLLDRLGQEAGLDVVELPKDAAVAATLRLRDHVRHPGDALPFVTRLPRPGQNPTARAGRAPTHLMNGAVAHAIGDGLTVGTAPPAGRRGLGLQKPGLQPHHCSLVRDGAQIRLSLVEGAPTLLNGLPAQEGALLRAGDRLLLGEPAVELSLVAVDTEP
jgi:hypothetical protein